ncbi:MAG: NAD(P)-dependent oxidoreductase [Cyanobacteria bacterium J06621_3]
MHVLVTGARGFLGRYVVAALIKSGHQVRGVSRQVVPDDLPGEASSTDQGFPNLSWVQADLTAAGEALAPILQDIDAVVHLAAAMSGDFETQRVNTVVATENLLAAMQLKGIARLVAVSSFSVYDYQAVAVGTVLDETSPLESRSGQCSTYTQMKLLQEDAVRVFEAAGGQITLVRPGMIYDREHLFNAFLGTRLPGNLWVRIGRSAQLPMAYAGHCAEVIIQSLNNENAVGQVLNVVDDDLPDQETYTRLFAATQEKRMGTLVIPWRLMDALSSGVWRLHQWLSIPVRLPGLLVPASLHARCKPIQYSNSKVKQLLNWTPTYDLARAIALSPPLLQPVSHSQTVESVES